MVLYEAPGSYKVLFRRRFILNSWVFIHEKMKKQKSFRNLIKISLDAG